MTPREPKRHLRITLGKNVRRFREALGWSQERLGEAAGLSQVYVSQVETAKTAASVDTIEKLAAGLGRSPIELLSLK
jgi:transcriptional regulator with XRE-family HTH domain